MEPMIIHGLLLKAANKALESSIDESTKVLFDSYLVKNNDRNLCMERFANGIKAAFEVYNDLRDFAEKHYR